jgi:hypothetical protein
VSDPSQSSIALLFTANTDRGVGGAADGMLVDLVTSPVAVQRGLDRGYAYHNTTYVSRTLMSVIVGMDSRPKQAEGTSSGAGGGAGASGTREHGGAAPRHTAKGGRDKGSMFGTCSSSTVLLYKCSSSLPSPSFLAFGAVAKLHSVCLAHKFGALPWPLAMFIMGHKGL